MNKTEFFAECAQFSKKHISYEASNELYRQGRDGRRAMKQSELDSVPLEAFYGVRETGGYAGGNCWGDSAHPFTSNSGEARLNGLDEFLEAHFPSISFLTYRKMERNLESSNFTESGYYGNCTDYELKSLRFEHVWDVLLEAGLVTED
jgi:hypothetical protein